jgi:hypothetical protein
LGGGPSPNDDLVAVAHFDRPRQLEVEKMGGWLGR